MNVAESGLVLQRPGHLLVLWRRRAGRSRGDQSKTHNAIDASKVLDNCTCDRNQMRMPGSAVVLQHDQDMTALARAGPRTQRRRRLACFASARVGVSAAHVGIFVSWLSLIAYMHTADSMSATKASAWSQGVRKCAGRCDHRSQQV